MAKQHGISKHSFLAAATLSCTLISAMAPVILHTTPAFAEEETVNEETEESEETPSHEYITMDVEVTFNFGVSDGEVFQPNVNIYNNGSASGSATLRQSFENERVYTIELNNYEKPTEPPNPYSFEVTNLGPGLVFRQTESHLDENGTVYRLTGVIEKAEDTSDEEVLDPDDSSEATPEEGSDPAVPAVETPKEVEAQLSSESVVDANPEMKADAPEMKEQMPKAPQSVSDKQASSKHVLPQTSDLSSLPMLYSLGLASLSAAAACVLRRKK